MKKKISSEDIKVIYLDIDGVLNTDLGIMRHWMKTKKNDYIDPVLGARFKWLCDAVPDAKIVISSMWRGHYTIRQMRKYLKDYVDPKRIIDMTPISKPDHWDFPDRGSVIAEHLRKHPEIKKYVIIDDYDSCISILHPVNFIYVNPITGLVEEDVIAAANLLSY